MPYFLYYRDKVNEKFYFIPFYYKGFYGFSNYRRVGGYQVHLFPFQGSFISHQGVLVCKFPKVASL